MIRTFDARVDVLRNGVRYKSLPFPRDNPPNIYADAGAAIKTSLTGTFLHDGAVDYLNDELKPILIIDGVESPVGVFRIGTVTAKRDTAHYDQIEAYDRALRLQQTKTENILHFDAGTNYLAAVKQLLTGAGIATVLETPTALTLATAREDWDVGTEYLTIVNALLAEINYNEISFDGNGTALLHPYAPPSVGTIRHSYDADTPLSILYTDTTAETDIYDAPNVFIAVVSNPDLGRPMVATAVNENPASALSTVRRGMRIPKMEKLDNIASQAALQDYADNMALRSMYATETVNFKTLAEPGHGIRDVISLRHPNIRGIYEETSWYLSLQAGKAMTHECKKAVIM